MAHGYRHEAFVRDNEPLITVDFGDGETVTLPSEVHQRISHESADSEDYKARILAAEGERLRDWGENRGPDSELGRNMEAGTPPQDEHGR